LVGKSSIPKADKEFDEVLDLGKKMSRTNKSSEIAHTELILSKDMKTRNGEIAFDTATAVRIIIILTVMRQVHGKSSRTRMNLFLHLPWLS
jgi:hypothetical protein